MSHAVVDAVEQYAKDVTSGVEVAGPLVRLACKRHLLDLETGESRGLFYDRDAARRNMSFFPDVLRLSGGSFEGLPFNLHGSQKFIVGSLFGWKVQVDNVRRFRVAFIEKGKGNGKSPLAAGIGLLMLVADKEQRAEVYFAAVDKDQAKIPFRDAVAMVDLSEDLSARIEKSGGKTDSTKVWNLSYLKTNSFCRPISSESTGKGKSGPRPHCAVLDEVHEHPTNAMVEFMRAGTKSRRQALIFMSTNSGVTDPNNVCFQYHQYAERVLNGLEINDTFFAYVCGLDGPRQEVVNGEVVQIPGDSWTDPTVWKKANPLLDIAVTSKYLEEQVRDALGIPSKQNLTRRLNFCEWVESVSPFIDMAVWAENGQPVNLEALRGRRCFGGIDLSNKNALSSISLVFEEDEDGVLDVLQFFWTPADTVVERSERDKIPFQQWIDEGFIVATPGKIIDYDYIALQIGELIKDYDVAAFAFDPWRMDELEKALHDIGLDQINTDEERAEIRLVKHGQGYQDMNPSIGALEDFLLEKRMRHGNNTVLTWCIGNAKVEENVHKLRMFNKRKSAGYIDGAQSLAMAAGLSVSFGGEKGGSYAVTIIG